ncbi:uncharacterized protein LOC133950091 isoform X1 [Platichthys flesus]|uniref:uncharacterized protein LOC133950091 isoform X1 n=1 Tax=Platichthys flesus TaxID=8260 RepID=UPI002DBFB2D7|nr:uncharacterized protein LOC133950091 isoform X1 [Platichthys flesus]
MDDCSPIESFPNLHHHRQRPSLHLTLPNLQSPEAGYQPALDPLEQYGTRGEQSAASFSNSSSSSGGRKGSSGGDRGFQNTSGRGMGGDDGLRGHRDRDGGPGGQFTDAWVVGIKKEEVWEDGESSTDVFYSKADCYNNPNGAFYTMNCDSEEGLSCKLRANYNNYTQVSCDAKSEAVYNREANFSHFTRCPSRSAAGSLSDSTVGYCRTDSRVSDNYSGREEDYGSSCGSGEDQLQQAEVEAHWLSMSPLSQTGEGRWRGEAEGGLPLRSPITISSGTYTQKLDSFSEAFLSQRKRRFPVIQSGDSSGLLWEFGETPGFVNSSHGCAFDSDPYLPPVSFSSPVHHSLPSFPSPPTSSHLVSSVLSPPPTPLPPPSHSPSKMDSPSASGGSGQESIGPLQFFTSHLQPLPSVHCSGMMWKFPVLSHSFPQTSGDPSSSDNNLRSSHVSHYGNITAVHDTLQAPESPFLTSPFHHSSLHPSPRDLCPLNAASLHLLSPPSHLTGPSNEAAEDTAPYLVSQKAKMGSAAVQQQASPVYTGTPFPSVLHPIRGRKKGHYTPRPLLNPIRRGTGLYSSLLPFHHKEDKLAFREVEEDCGVLRCVNVGFEFQAELPPCCVQGNGSEAWSPDDQAPREQLLWKPLLELEESANLQNQVDKLLSLCSSSCLPGGGSNTELALHCLHHCQGNTMATVEMLLFWQPSSAGDYHYSGSDFWTDAEKSLFGAALGTYGKDFSLIHKMVRTKTVSQCIEFYYLSKKLVDKQRKQQEEENRDEELQQQKSVTPICQPAERRFGQAEAVPAPSLASFFPCKLCGKMFYKIKSRNAHMKIHRQPQEDWGDRRLQHQILTQRLALSRSANPMPTSGSNLLPPHAPALTFASSGTSHTSSNADIILNSITSSNTSTPSAARGPRTAVTYNNVPASNSRVITSVDAGDSNQREPTSVLPFHQTWSSYGPGPTQAVFFCNTDGKEEPGDGTVGGKEPINWQ